MLCLTAEPAAAGTETNWPGWCMTCGAAVAAAAAPRAPCSSMSSRCCTAISARSISSDLFNRRCKANATSTMNNRTHRKQSAHDSVHELDRHVRWSMQHSVHKDSPVTDQYPATTEVHRLQREG
jgi:hypothetical protein